MSMLESLPTVEEMMIALSSPVVPNGQASVGSISEVAAAELSTDDMIKEIFNMLNEQKYAAGQTASAAPDMGLFL